MTQKIKLVWPDDEGIARISCLYRSVEMDFQQLARARNMSDIIMTFFACECLCTVYPIESGEKNGLNFVTWVEPHVATLYREIYHIL